MGNDVSRRSIIRTFLTEQRARLKPEDVGLPKTQRRRVPGLRREEVAELVNVTPDWYRGLESGRVRVSPRLIARIAAALRLGQEERRTLYRIALPEIYDFDTSQRFG